MYLNMYLCIIYFYYSILLLLVICPIFRAIIGYEQIL